MNTEYWNTTGDACGEIVSNVKGQYILDNPATTLNDCFFGP